jgi:hypothetical protein
MQVLLEFFYVSMESSQLEIPTLLARIFNFMFCYIDDIFSLNNSAGWFVGRIYKIEHEINDNTDIAWSTSYLDKLLNIDY